MDASAKHDLGMWLPRLKKAEPDLEHRLDFFFSDDYWKMQSEDAETQNKYQRERGHYPYIPFDTTAFLNAIYKWKRGKFLDVGCGVGDKVFFAKLLGFEAHGVEYSQVTVPIAHRLFPEVDVVQGNAISFDYSSFDVIYSYCPIMVAKFYWEMGLQILGTMKPGAVWIEVLPNKWSTDKSCPIRELIANVKHRDLESMDKENYHEYFGGPVAVEKQADHSVKFYQSRGEDWIKGFKPWAWKPV